MTERIIVHGQLTWDPVRRSPAYSATVKAYVIGTGDTTAATPLPAYGEVGQQLTDGVVTITPDGHLPETGFDVPDGEVGVLIVGPGVTSTGQATEYRTIVWSEQAILRLVAAMRDTFTQGITTIQAAVANLEAYKTALTAEYGLFKQQVQQQIAQIDDPLATYSGPAGYLLGIDTEGVGVIPVDPATLGGGNGGGTGVDRDAVIAIINEVGLAATKVSLATVPGLTGITDVQAAIAEVVRRVSALSSARSAGIEFYLWDVVAQGWEQNGSPVNPQDAPAGTWLRVFINHARPEAQLPGVEDFDFYAVTTA